MAAILKDVDAPAGVALLEGSPHVAADERGALPPSHQAAGSACLCVMVGGLLRLALAVAAVLGLVAGAAELGLRAFGAKPGRRSELANTVPDGWTDFRLRPSVSGQEIDVTNDLGMHAPRSYTLARPPGTLRVAVLGSSVQASSDFTEDGVHLSPTGNVALGKVVAARISPDFARRSVERD